MKTVFKDFTYHIFIRCILQKWKILWESVYQFVHQTDQP